MHRWPNIAFVLVALVVTPTRSFADAPSPGSAQEQSAFALAKDYLDKGDYEQAEILFKKLLEVYPGNGLGFYYYAKTLEHIPDREADIIAAYDSAYRIGPSEEYGLKAYVASQMLQKKQTAKRAEADRAAAEQQAKEAQAVIDKQQSDNETRRTILHHLREKFVVIWRDNAKADDKYCIWLRDFPAQVSLSGADLGKWTLGARLAGRPDAQPFAWPATAAWQNDPIRLEVRRSGQGAAFGLDVTITDGKLELKPASFPYHVIYAQKPWGEACG